MGKPGPGDLKQEDSEVTSLETAARFCVMPLTTWWPMRHYAQAPFPIPPLQRHRAHLHLPPPSGRNIKLRASRSASSWLCAWWLLAVTLVLVMTDDPGLSRNVDGKKETRSDDVSSSSRISKGLMEPDRYRSPKTETTNSEAGWSPRRDSNG